MRKVSALFASFILAGFLALPVIAAETAPATEQKPAAQGSRTVVQPNPVTPGSQTAAQSAAAVSQDKAAGEAAPTAPAKPILPVPATSVNTVKPVSPVSVKPVPAVKIGFVDMVRIANESAPGKAAYADIKARTAKFKSRIEAKKKQLEKEKAAIEAKIQTLTPQERNAKAKAFQKKLEDFQKFVEKAQKELEARESELLGKLYKSIENSANEYGKANGLAVVVTKKDLLYVGANVDVKDITGEIAGMVSKEREKK